MESTELDKLQKQAYFEYHEDGFLELGIGLFLLLVYLISFLGKFVGFTVYLPLLMIYPMIRLRQKIRLTHLGHVEFDSKLTARNDHRTMYLLAAIAFAGFLGLIGFALLAEFQKVWFDFVVQHGVSFWIVLGGGALLMIGYFRQAPYYYAFALIYTGLCVVKHQFQLPVRGSVLAPLGLVITGWGSYLLWQFLKKHPKPAQPILDLMEKFPEQEVIAEKQREEAVVREFSGHGMGEFFIGLMFPITYLTLIKQEISLRNFLPFVLFLIVGLLLEKLVFQKRINQDKKAYIKKLGEINRSQFWFGWVLYMIPFMMLNNYEDYLPLSWSPYIKSHLEILYMGWITSIFLTGGKKALKQFGLHFLVGTFGLYFLLLLIGANSVTRFGVPALVGISFGIHKAIQFLKTHPVREEQTA